MAYNCSACGGTHDNMGELQACHLAKKQAELEDASVKQEAATTTPEVFDISEAPDAPPEIAQIADFREQIEELTAKIAFLENEKANSNAPEILSSGDCRFILTRDICPDELSYLSNGQYAELKIRGFMSAKGFEVDSVEYS